MNRQTNVLEGEVTTGEMAAALGVTQVTVCSMVRRGELTARRDAHGWYRIPATEAERILAKRPENGFMLNRYDQDTKAKLRALAEYEGVSLTDVLRALIQREYQRVIGGKS